MSFLDNKNGFIYLVIILGLAYIFLPESIANTVTGVIAVIIFYRFYRLKQNPTLGPDDADWKVVNKFDWRVFLPVGVVLLVYSLNQPNVNQDSILVKIAVLILFLGVVNIFSKFIFKDPKETFGQKIETQSQTANHAISFVWGLLIFIAAILIIFVVGSIILVKFNVIK